MKICNFLFVGVLAVSPIAAAFAQGTGPNMKADASKEATATKDGSATNPNQPGATGSTLVPGSNSTVAGDKGGTQLSKTGDTTGGGAK
jgi:hypothetical protein